MRRTAKPLSWADVTPKSAFLGRRAVIAGGIAGGLALALPPAAMARIAAQASDYSTDAAPNTLDEITSYNNFIEFGPAKSDPKKHGRLLTLDPWSVEIDGLVERPGSYALADILKLAPMEERIYRFRCVEAWAMVIPWIGQPLAALLAHAGVRPGAKHVAFQTLHRPNELPGQRQPGYDWPYVEGLRLDEAMHPLTLLASGLYGEELPPQNGAPLRLVVPWKYGFKSIKSIVRITLTEAEPPTTWNRLQPEEYGYYANVNPEVDHPRWSQATERRIGAGIFAAREPSQMFNGYGPEVAALYAGMDLRAKY